jgi:hypothetical protein
MSSSENRKGSIKSSGICRWSIDHAENLNYEINLNTIKGIKKNIKYHMESKKEKINEIKWEISEGDIKRRMNQKFLFIITIITISLSFVFLLIFSKYLAFLALAALIILSSFGHYINAKIKYDSGVPFETYRIDEKGIEVVRSRGNDKELFLWSEISGYHLVDKNLMAFMAYFFDILGRKINDHRKFSLSVASKTDYEKAVAELSKRTKIK